MEVLIREVFHCTGDLGKTINTQNTRMCNWNPQFVGPVASREFCTVSGCLINSSSSCTVQYMREF